MLIVGIVFRFVNLDKKVYWHDETFTSLRVSAHPQQELIEHTFVGREVSAAELQAYQHLDLNRGLGQVLHWLAHEDPHHPPLYTVTLRLWLQTIGDSVATTRLFSAMISLLIFPCFYWLCWELFHSSLAGWVGVALMSVSPFHVVFAQEAREYALWTLMTVVSTAALLRALRSPTRRRWLLYTGTLILSFYTSLLALPVALGQGIYVLLRDYQRRSPTHQPADTKQVRQQGIAWAVSFLYAVLAFTPWLWVLMHNFSSFTAGMAWIHQPLPFEIWLKLWGLNLGRAFIDFNSYVDDPTTFWAIAPILLLELISLYWICRSTSKRIWLLIVILMLVIAVPIALADLLLGGQRSTATRYLVPLELGLQLLIVGTLVTQLKAIQHWRRVVSGCILVTLLLVGGLSSFASIQADAWWNKGINYYYPQVAQVINRSDRPLIISDAFDPNPGDILALSYLVNPNVRFLLLPQIQDSFTLPQGIDTSRSLFLIGLPDPFLSEFAKQYKVNLIPLVKGVWRSQNFNVLNG